ncbi:MAG: hypothetical protein Q9184_006597 [Pyrenodesmia sp. 2 TL-2023]
MGASMKSFTATSFTLTEFKNLVHLSDTPQYVARLAALRRLARQFGLDAAIKEREGPESMEVLSGTIEYFMSGKLSYWRKVNREIVAFAVNNWDKVL